MAIKELIISSVVPANQSEAETYVVPDGKTIEVRGAKGSSIAGSSSVAIIWDYDGASEEIVWFLNDDSGIPYKFEATGDGVKKLAIELRNGPGGQRELSGYLRFEEQD